VNDLTNVGGFGYGYGGGSAGGALIIQHPYGIDYQEVSTTGSGITFTTGGLTLLNEPREASLDWLDRRVREITDLVA
jgi:hypothetical protein